MKQKLLSLVLALVMCLGLLPVTALAAGSTPPDWNFLVLFVPMDADYEEDGATKHVKTSISEENVNTLVSHLVEFESVMKESGVMTPHFTKYSMLTPITMLSATNVGPYPSLADIAAYLKDYSNNIDLDAYDHVFVLGRLDNVNRSYGGITPLETFDNGMTYSFIPADYLLRDWGSTPKRPAYVLVHEFLHTMEMACGYSFDLHAIEADIVPGYQSDEKYKACMLDIIHNRIKGEHGSGIAPNAWSHSLRTLRTIRELTISNDVATIGSYRFKNCTNLERVVIPSTVTSIKDHAFQFCTGLTEVTLPASISSIEEGTFEQCTALTEITIPSNVASIGIWAFESCTSLKKITIPASVTSIGDAAFQRTGLTDVYYSGTEAQWKAIKIGEYNSPLTNATIHYNSPTPTQPTTTTTASKFTDVKTGDYFADPVRWAVEKGITSGTSATTFSPNQNCTVAQILTFLWRANGSPKPAGSNPFSDVKDSDYYADAAAWAYEKGMVSGRIFGGNTPCTRSMAVTYMWKAAGSPSAKAASFTDVSAGAEYANAVAWAVEQGVTAGTSATTFSPNNVCTRGQIVTFLYRGLAK